MLDKNDSFESSEPKKDHSKEKKTSGRVLTVEAAILRPENDYSKEKKISKGYAGTAQDADWSPKRDHDDCSRRGINDSHRIQGEYEH